MKIEVDHVGSWLDHAASIWSAATAARDGTLESASLEEARPIIQAVFTSSPRAFLVLVTDRNKPHGFAALSTATEDETAAELVYFGVEPSHWGKGIGATLLTALPPILAAKNFSMAFLNVYSDNKRAVNLYESRGWVPIGAPVPQFKTKRSEQRFVLQWERRMDPT